MRIRPPRLFGHPRPGIALPRARTRPAVRARIRAHQVRNRGHQAPRYGRREVLRSHPL